MIYNLLQNHKITYDTKSKRFSSRRFRGHNLHPRVTDLSTQLAISLFPSKNHPKTRS